MLSLTKITQATKAFIKVIRFGTGDVQTATPVMPFGIDSKPVKDIQGVHANTVDKNESLILGYTIESDETNPGEFRIFCTDSDGVEQFSMYFKNDGTVEFGGNTDNLIKYTPLSNALTSFKNAIQAELGEISIGISGAGGGYTPGTLTLDISGAKIDDIKV